MKLGNKARSRVKRLCSRETFGYREKFRFDVSMKDLLRSSPHSDMGLESVFLGFGCGDKWVISYQETIGDEEEMELVVSAWSVSPNFMQRLWAAPIKGWREDILRLRVDNLFLSLLQRRGSAWSLLVGERASCVSLTSRWLHALFLLPLQALRTHADPDAAFLVQLSESVSIPHTRQSEVPAYLLRSTAGFCLNLGFSLLLCRFRLEPAPGFMAADDVTSVGDTQGHTLYVRRQDLDLEKALMEAIERKVDGQWEFVGLSDYDMEVVDIDETRQRLSGVVSAVAEVGPALSRRVVCGDLSWDFGAETAGISVWDRSLDLGAPGLRRLQGDWYPFAVPERRSTLAALACPVRSLATDNRSVYTGRSLPHIQTMDGTFRIRL